MSTHRWSPGFRAKIAANIAQQEFERIREKAGALTPPAVFEAAKPKKAPLHDEFVWDGPTAVRELGLIRARQMIRAVVVVEEEKPPVREWTYVPDPIKPAERGAYEPTTTVVQHVDQFEAAVTHLQRRFDAAAEALEELRQSASGSANEERLAAISLAVQGFGAVREALAILR